MINLIPNQEKKKVIKSFYYRLTVLFFVMLSFSLFIAVLTLLPSYFLSISKNNIARNKVEIQKTIPMTLSDQEDLAVVKDLNNKLSLIENAQKNKFSVSEKVIQAIFLKKNSSIKINQISYEDNSLKGKKISIHGTAPSREVLLLFRQSLEDDASFKSIDLPISNFIKGADIQFYLNLIPT